MEARVNMSEMTENRSAAAILEEKRTAGAPVTRVITVTLNPAFDRAVTLDGLEIERVNRVLSERVDPGGKGVNVSRVLTAFSVANTAIVLAGQDNVTQFRRLLQNEKVRAVFLPIDGSIRENTTFTTPDGKLFKVDKAGARVTGQVLYQVEHAVSEQFTDPAGTVVVFAGSLPPGLDGNAFTELLRRLSGQGIRVALDSQSLTLEQILAAKPWVIKPNIHELRALMKRELKDRREVTAAAVSLVRQGIENVMVSMGEDGLLLVDRNQAIKVTPPTVKAISTVGAGDSTLAGFLFAKSKGLTNDHAAPIASAFGTAAVLTEGTNVPRKDEFSRILKQMSVSRLRLS